MLKLRFLFLSVLLSTGLLKSQDSTQTRLLNHEIGLNAVSILSQFKFFTPPNTQSPYLVFYNLYYKEVIGFRAGLGISRMNIQSEVEGQNNPRITNANTAQVRLGFSYNFARTKRVVLNGFADYVYYNSKLETSFTSTVQAQGDPLSSRTVESSDLTYGSGGQAGVGLKINVHKMLAFYAELPVTFLFLKTTTRDAIIESGQPTIETKGVAWNSTLDISLPGTIYLVLRF